MVIEELPACFKVKDRNGQALAYVYFDEKPGQQTLAKQLTRDDAWRIATHIASLPGLLKE